MRVFPFEAMTNGHGNLVADFRNRRVIVVGETLDGDRFQCLFPDMDGLRDKVLSVNKNCVVFVDGDDILGLIDLAEDMLTRPTEEKR